MSISAITDTLLERLDLIRIDPAVILIYGNDVDHIDQYLKRRYLNPSIKTITCLEKIKSCEDHSIDLIISSLTLQLEENIKIILQEFFRILKKNGLLLLTTLGPDSFSELKKNSEEMKNFVDMHHIGDWLKEFYFKDVVMDMQKIIFSYDSLSLLSQDVGSLGLRNLNTYDPKFKAGDHYLLTLEIIYGHALKIELPPKQDEIAIPVQNFFKREKKAEKCD
ncbi:MAG: hypothetical protein ACD_46C00590G0002 [uncultured bacterium]|nr:MAG: hypothetical protein ACD_46C00590G0002 [uncultured bacterium]